MSNLWRSLRRVSSSWPLTAAYMSWSATCAKCAKIPFYFLCFWEALKCHMWHSCHHLRKPALHIKLPLPYRVQYGKDKCQHELRIKQLFPVLLMLTSLSCRFPHHTSIRTQLWIRNGKRSIKWGLWIPEKDFITSRITRVFELQVSL